MKLTNTPDQNNRPDAHRLTEATQILYASVMADDSLSPFFEGLDVARIESRQRQFLSYALEGTTNPHIDLRAAHAPLLAKGLNHAHFDALMVHLTDALTEAGYTTPETEAAVTRIDGFRAEVLGETHTRFSDKEHSMMKRTMIMTYAVVSYAVGMASLAYTAGWLGGFLTPTQLDDPTGRFTLLGLLANVALVVGFGLQHSIMARPRFKAWWTRVVPAAAERATYVLFSGIAMLAMMWFWTPLGVDIWRIEGAAAVGAWTLYGLGWFILVSSTFFLNHFDLFGLRQAWINLRGQAYTHIPFATPGYYRIVRHPIYVGWLLLIWATPTMTVSHLVFAVATTIYILVAIPMEERDLENMLPEYEDYKASTPALVPGSRRAPRRQTA